MRSRSPLLMRPGDIKTFPSSYMTAGIFSSVSRVAASVPSGFLRRLRTTLISGTGRRFSLPMIRADDPAHPELLAAARSFGRSSASAASALTASLAARAILPESSGGACSARAAARASVKAFRAAAMPADVVAAAVTMFRAAARSAAAFACSSSNLSAGVLTSAGGSSGTGSGAVGPGVAGSGLVFSGAAGSGSGPASVGGLPPEQAPSASAAAQARAAISFVFMGVSPVNAGSVSPLPLAAACPAGASRPERAPAFAPTAAAPLGNREHRRGGVIDVQCFLRSETEFAAAGFKPHPPGSARSSQRPKPPSSLPRGSPGARFDCGLADRRVRRSFRAPGCWQPWSRPQRQVCLIDETADRVFDALKPGIGSACSMNMHPGPDAAVDLETK